VHILSIGVICGGLAYTLTYIKGKTLDKPTDVMLFINAASFMSTGYGL
jgi:hypothetical protein